MKDIIKDIYSTMLSDENRLLNGAMTAEEYQEMKSVQDLYDDSPKDFLIPMQEDPLKQLQIDYGLIGEIDLTNTLDYKVWKLLSMKTQIH